MRLPFTSLLLVFFLPLLFLSTTGHSEVLCIEKEKQALLDFKLSFVWDPDNTLSSWSNDNDDCCSWEGVECSKLTGHVITLRFDGSLESYNLRPSLLELEHLTLLDLKEVQATIRIPKFLGSLSNLVVLNLADVGFFGEVPPNLGNLSKLQKLDLSGSNDLYADSLQWLSHLSSIAYLDFSNVRLSSAIDWASTIKMLPTLSTFKCSSCSLPDPQSLSSISFTNSSTSLQSLDLSDNNVSSSAFSYLINGANSFKYLSLNFMKMEYNLHDFFRALNGRARDSLVQLSLVGNNLNKLPFGVMRFPSLTLLDASSNYLSGSLPEILRYLSPNLTSLDLSSNRLSGIMLDEHLSMFVQLEFLLLAHNNLLTFNFSEGWVPPFQLVTLDLRSCEVGPSFPSWILTQKSLNYFDISNSMISGAIPDAFWNNSLSASYLNLSHNEINCQIPNLSFSFVEFPNIDLKSNAFDGPIPLFLFSASTLDLSNNKFSSFSPLNPRGLSLEIQIINLSGNLLSGSLPDWLFQCDRALVLNLANNMFSGTLPRAIGSLWQLLVLHLSNNKFFGELPLSMKNCTQLRILELASNEFSGVVPFWIESMQQLIILTLRSNNLSGDLPSTLCHLRSLQILDLSDNKISGCIPGCVSNFTTMTTDKGLSDKSMGEYQLYLSTGDGNVSYIILLDYASVMWKGVLEDLYSRSLVQRNVINLSGNLLRGEIPAELTTLKALRSLDLSRNDLNGSIPDNIGNLTSLEVLKLSSNRLYGEIPQSLAVLTFLDTLNLSNNDLSGRIPTSTQLQSFSASYAGNPKLCGQPLPTKCLGDEDGGEKQPLLGKDVHGKDDESFDIQAFFAALGMGFAFGFLGVLGILHFNRPWRLAFFKFGDNMANRIFVTTSLFQSRIKRSLCFIKANGAENM